METQTMDYTAQELLARASVLEVNGHLIKNNVSEEINKVGGETVFYLFYTSSKGVLYNFEFSEKALKEATLEDGHFLWVEDASTEMIKIGLYNLLPLETRKSLD